MKRTTIPATLSFLVPGAGLWYLGLKVKAVINFIVGAIFTALAVFSGHEYFHYMILAVAAGSSGYAHAAAANAPRPSATTKQKAGC